MDRVRIEGKYRFPNLQSGICNSAEDQSFFLRTIGLQPTLLCTVQEKGKGNVEEVAASLVLAHTEYRTKELPWSACVVDRLY